MTNKPAVLSEGGFSVLEDSLAETLARLSQREIADLLAGEFGANDLIRVVATTPPFGEVLAARIRQRLRRPGS